MVRSKRILRWTLVFGVVCSVGWFFNLSLANNNEETYYKIDKGLFYLKEVFETISQNYVDELDPENLSKSAIEGMLSEFDPYTVFFEDPGSHQMRMITRGKYGGIGMEIGVQNGEITVITPMEGTPAQNAGIRAGDIILKIDGRRVKEMSLEDASQSLRGKVGTHIRLQFKRPGIDEPFSLDLMREEIVLKDVTYADFLESGTVYIQLSAFSDKAGKELKEVIQELSARGTINQVILDLRGNPGGLLTSAVEVANVFLPPGQLLVSTRGSHEDENKFYTKEQPILPTQPLVVLVNNASASASEIVAGAIQDLDRGVLVGTTTFGKGLVQKVYPIDRVTQAYLKITTAKYYVPSGRSIQKEDYKQNTEVFTNLADSIEYNQKTNYYTQNGRVVHGGGGIQPDIIVGNSQLDGYLNAMSGKGMFFQFAVKYLAEHPELKSGGPIVIDDIIMAEFEAFLDEKRFSYELEGEKELRAFLQISGSNGYGTDVDDLVQVALQKMNSSKQSKFTEHRLEIQHLLEAEFVDKQHGNASRIRSLLSYDEQVKAGIKVLRDLQAYQGLLVAGK